MGLQLCSSVEKACAKRYQFNEMCTDCNCGNKRALQSCLTLCNTMDCNPLGSSVPGIFQARILEWVAMTSSRGSSCSGIRLESLVSPALAGKVFIASATWEASVWRTGALIVMYRRAQLPCGRGSNPCALHYKADSQPLGHQASPPGGFLRLANKV